jgi:hypothetical protein
MGSPSGSSGPAAARSRSKQIIDTLTLAPSAIHGSSLHAAKILPSAEILSITFRFWPPRMEFVATNPARLVLPEAICCQARANQKVTKSAPPEFCHVVAAQISHVVLPQLGDHRSAAVAGSVLPISFPSCRPH